MIHPISNQVIWTYVAIPVWQLETPATPAAADDSGCIQRASPGADAAPQPLEEPRLVFKGYEWQAVAHWDPFVNPGWDHWVDNDPDEIREREVRVERERQQAAAAAPTQHAQTSVDNPLHPGTAADDVRHGIPPPAETYSTGR
jgi:hypothetical protein